VPVGGPRTYHGVHTRRFTRGPQNTGHSWAPAHLSQYVLVSCGPSSVCAGMRVYSDEEAGRSRRKAGEDIVSLSTPPLQLGRILMCNRWSLEPHSAMNSIQGYEPRVIFSRRHVLSLLPGLCVYVCVCVCVCDMVDVDVHWSYGCVEASCY
jgi:hypothetical protein